MVEAEKNVYLFSLFGTVWPISDTMTLFSIFILREMVPFQNG